MTTVRNVALFVEGSASPATPRGAPALQRIWTEHLCELAGVHSFSTVVPISKKHLVAMDPSNPPMSGAAEPLDQLIGRALARSNFDAAVIAWDLTPAWNPRHRGCRWEETLSLYSLLAVSESLPAAWTAYAKKRHEDLSGRVVPQARAAAPRLEPGACLALCMVPMFEDILTKHESGLKRVLGVAGQSTVNWPRWHSSSNPDRDLIGPAIACVPRRSTIHRRIRGDFRTKKDEWAEYLLRQLMEDPAERAQLANHPFATRLRELLQDLYAT